MRLELYLILFEQSFRLCKLTPQTTYRNSTLGMHLWYLRLIYTPTLNPCHPLFQPFPTVIRFCDCEIILQRAIH